jgi:hypothetical protein
VLQRKKPLAWPESEMGGGGQQPFFRDPTLAHQGVSLHQRMAMTFAELDVITKS